MHTIFQNLYNHAFLEGDRLKQVLLVFYAFIVWRRSQGW